MEILTTMAEGALASCAAAVVSTPFEVIKVRLQLQGELMRRGQYQAEYNGIWSGLYKILRTEGLRGVQSGLVSSFAHQSVLNGFRLGLFYPVRTEVMRVTGIHGVHIDLLVGLLCGVIGAFLGSPLFLVKTRLQSQRAPSSTGSPGDHNAKRHYRGLWDGLSSIYKADGPRGLLRGAGTSCARTAVGSAIQLSSYEEIKRLTVFYTGREAHDTIVHLISSMVASFFGAMMMNPLDVIMTRRFNTDSSTYQRNIISTAGLIVKSEGFLGLGKGAFALWARLGPHTIVTFVVLEKIRHVRQSTFGFTQSELARIEALQQHTQAASKK